VPGQAFPHYGETVKQGHAAAGEKGPEGLSGYCRTTSIAGRIA
jgi:hypothetical protein